MYMYRKLAKFGYLYGGPLAPRRVVLFSFCWNVFFYLHFDKTKIKMCQNKIKTRRNKEKTFRLNENKTTLRGTNGPPYMWDVQTDRQTDRQTERHAIIHTPTGDEVKMSWQLGVIYIECCRLEKRGKSLEDFDYSNEEIMNEIYMAMNSTDFVGVSVRFKLLTSGPVWANLSTFLF